MSSGSPRACGEQLPARNAMALSIGSSPRLRGTAAFFVRKITHSGSSRACGERTNDTSRPSSQPVHPRACGEQVQWLGGETPKPGSSRAFGEQFFHWLLTFLVHGSSPRLRGTALQRRHSDEFAGSSPRLRGTDEPIRYRVRLDRFIPRLRGTVRQELQAKERIRFIPAPAGNSPVSSPSGSARAVHPPRLRGTERLTDKLRLTNGSSRRLRGTVRYCALGNVEHRFIPRACGEQFRTSRLGLLYPRFIRACGDRPRLRGYRDRPAFIPRACGEQMNPFATASALIGSSPRLRGTAARATSFFPVPRFIPAPAGNS